MHVDMFGAGMAFIRIKVNKSTGAVYRYWQGSKRVPGRANPISMHLGPAGDRQSPAMLLNEETMAGNQAALEAGKFVTEADPTGKENAPTEGEG